MSLIRINRKCKECNEGFVAKTISSVYFSKKCYKREYNRTKKSEQIKSPKIKIVQTIEEISTKSYLTIKEAALLYPISETTIRRAIKTDGEKRFVQFFGDVSAGFPSPAADFVQNNISLDEILLNHPEATYLNRVGGENMFPEYLKGDLLIIRSDIEPRHRDDIVVSVNNSEYTFKRYDAINKQLISLNPKYKNCIQLQDEDVVIILGVVTDLVRHKRK